MLKKTVTYTDYDGNKRKEDFWFDLSQYEINKFNLNTEGGLKKVIENIIDTQDQKRMFELFEQIVCLAYGERSIDGRTFDKSQEVLARFKNTKAYGELIMQLIQDDKLASDFIQGIIPTIPDVVEDGTNIIEMSTM